LVSSTKDSPPSIPVLSLAKVNVEPSLLDLVPRELAARLGVLPVYLRRDGGRTVLYVAMTAPCNDAALRECSSAARVRVRPMIAEPAELRAAIAHWYDGAPWPAPPPPPPRPAPPVVEELSADELIEHSTDPPPGSSRTGTVLVIAGRDTFLHHCGVVAEQLGARLESAELASATLRAKELAPFAVVVDEDLYAFDRLGLTRLALANGALLVIWSDELELEYLEPLLAIAHERWARDADHRTT
jgi:hypothetical protein